MYGLGLLPPPPVTSPSCDSLSSPWATALKFNSVTSFPNTSLICFCCSSVRWMVSVLITSTPFRSVLHGPYFQRNSTEVNRLPSMQRRAFLPVNLISHDRLGVFLDLIIR